MKETWRKRTGYGKGTVTYTIGDGAESGFTYTPECVNTRSNRSQSRAFSDSKHLKRGEVEERFADFVRGFIG
jgi:hypothetical protein